MNAFVLAHQTFSYSYTAAKNQFNPASKAIIIFLICSETQLFKTTTMTALYVLSEFPIQI